MVQFNLLPDVKKDYIKANRTKRLVMSGSIIVSVTVITFTVLLFGFVQLQKNNISDLTADIESKTAAINETENLDSILTLQNQLSLVSGLHESKQETSRVFDIVKFVSPQGMRLDSLDLDTELSTLAISGNADTAAVVNLLVDNIKAAQYTTTTATDIEAKTRVFSGVNTTINGNTTSTTFEILMTYDPLIFNNYTGLYMSIGNQDLVEIVKGEPNNEQ